MRLTLDDIYDEFEALDREDQSQYLLELGDDLPPFPDDERIDANRVHGCQSQVWMIPEPAAPGSDVFRFAADSDSSIVRGLIAILLAAYHEKSPQQILDFDIVGVFQRLHLQQHISPQRRNGLRGMVDRIHALARNRLPVGATAGVTSGKAVRPSPVRSLSIQSAPFEPLRAEEVRRQFPVLNRLLPSGRRPVYLDSGASAQKPQVVIDKEREVEEQYFANAYRGTYQFGLRIDEELERSRHTIAKFLNAPTDESIVFTPGTTIGLNMIAAGWGRTHVQAGDEILTTVMEHHANFVPWQQLALERGAVLRLMPLTGDGRLDLNRLDEVLTPRTKLVAISAMSNMLGTINPVRELTRRAHAAGACVVVDAAQSCPHLRTDVVADDVDFLVFSGHKVYGPTGVGILYGKPSRLDEMAPVFFGGHMISRVRVEESTWAPAPAKFEAGTLPIVQAIALGTAIDWMTRIGLDAIHEHEERLLVNLMTRLHEVRGLRIFGPDIEYRGGIVSFRIDGVHPEDLAAVLDQHGVFTRHGHHCTMPLHDHLGVSATTRVSLAAYSSDADIDALLVAINEAVRMLRKPR